MGRCASFVDQEILRALTLLMALGGGDFEKYGGTDVFFFSTFVTFWAAGEEMWSITRVSRCLWI